MGLFSTIQATALEKGDHLAIVSGVDGRAEEMSYRSLYRTIARFQKKLTAVDSEKVVAIVANKSATMVASILASMLSGVATAVIDPRQGKHRVQAILSSLNLGVVMVDPQTQRLLDGVAFSAPTVLLSDVAPSEIEGEPVLLPLKDDSSRCEIILYTSGSTGMPKGVRIAAEDLLQRLTVECEWFELSAEDKILSVLPLTFDVGLTQMLASLYIGACSVIVSSWFPADILSHIKYYRPVGLALSPMVWKMLLKQKDQDTLWLALNTLRYVTLSGGTLPPEQLEHLALKLDRATLIKTYGQTEMFRIASAKIGVSDADLTSVGPLYPGVRVDILDEDGKVCGIDQVGEIVASGMGKMVGYYQRDAHSTLELRDVIRTGDLGKLDKNGHLFVLGRRDEMVKILDQRVYPDDVATSIGAILALKEAYVVVRDEGEPVLAAFVLSSELKVDENAALTSIRRQLASHLVPKYLLGVEAFPVTSSGKIDKQALLRLLLQALP